MAPFVKKLFPMEAIKHTLKSNPYAPYFCLLHKKEMEVLRRIYNTTQNIDDLKWLSLHVWRVDTRIACLKDSKLWQIFIDDICNSYEFKAAYNNVYDKAIAACTKYTLSKDEVVKVCEHDAVNVNLRPNARAVVFHELFVAQKLEMLQSLDTILYQDSSSELENVREIAKNCLGLLLRWEKYVPNLEPKQLTVWSGYPIWEEKANPVVVAAKMAEYWKKGQNFGKIEAFAEKLAKVGSKDARGEAKRLVNMLPFEGHKMQAVKMLIQNNIAMPQYVGYFFRMEDMTTFESNLELCRYQQEMGFIPRKDIEALPEKYQEQILIAVAKEGILPQEMFDKASPELKTKLFDIIEENAQMKWFRPLVERKPEGNVVGTLKSLHRISGRVQDMSLTYPCWAEVFASEGFYDGEHIIKLLQSKNYHAIWKLVQKQGLTREQYTAMLFGPLSAQAPQFEAYVKK